MGWNNPNMPWVEMEWRLSGTQPLVTDPLVESPHTRRRPVYQAPPIRRVHTTTPYAELHCHSNFSFLDGASHPEELVQEAVRLGLEALAITDHDGCYGVVRFAEAAREHGLPTVFGAELSLELTRPQAGEPDPAGRHLLVLARGQEGYARLARAISEGQMEGGGKGRPVYNLERLAETGRGHWLILTGCRKGLVPSALAGLPGTAKGDGEISAIGRNGTARGNEAAGAELDRLVALFGRDSVAVELIDHGQPDDDERNDALAALAAAYGLPVVATNNVHYASPGRRRLATALAAIRARRGLDDLDGWLPAAASAHLRTGAEMAARFGAYPSAVANAARLGLECAFDLHLVAPDLPPFPVPPGYTEMTWLRHLAYMGAWDRYGPPSEATEAYDRIDHELRIIEELHFPGYFLVVHEIVSFCHENDILCQGRGSAANSAVCFALGITPVDAVLHNMLFERFLAPERDGPPDIDLDIESDRREEVIQHVYTKYGRENTAQVANVISYRPRSAIRDVARAFGFSPGQQDAWSKQIDRWGPPGEGRSAISVVEGIPDHVVDFANQLQTFPRHLGIHSGGMVICDRPVVEVCPVEWARMKDRSVLQWDKDDCAAIGLVKFDLLGLGMLAALHYCFDLVRDHHGEDLTLHTLPQEDPEVYAMLCRADSIGVFQVESRAQMATLPRLRPTKFYDLVVEVALIRPGPIQGGAVHPYIRRRNGQEEVKIPHPRMEDALARTYGVPLFQEQLMQLAIDVSGFNATEADQLRRAMGAKRSTEQMEKLKSRLYEGMAVHGITGALADDIYAKLAAFANFGFPESHAMSFAYLVYASSWLKRFYPAAFCAALLNAQPMGFYSAQTLVADARRHGVTVLRPDVNISAAKATVSGNKSRAAREAPPKEWGSGGPAVRLGLSTVRGVSDEVAERITAHAPYSSMTDLSRRAELTAAHLEALATAGACESLGLGRREALWAAGAAAQDRPDRLPNTVTGVDAPTLPGMDPVELTAADIWATGLSPDSHPAQYARLTLDAHGAVPIDRLGTVESGRRVVVGGVVTHRQRPGTAGGITFLNLEDETGMLNVICSPGLWHRYRRVARAAPAMLVRGRLERAEGVTNLVADHLARLTLPIKSKSRDFR